MAEQSTSVKFFHLETENTAPIDETSKREEQLKIREKQLILENEALMKRLDETSKKEEQLILENEALKKRLDETSKKEEQFKIREKQLILENETLKKRLDETSKKEELAQKPLIQQSLTHQPLVQQPLTQQLLIQQSLSTTSTTAIDTATIQPLTQQVLVKKQSITQQPPVQQMLTQQPLVQQAPVNLCQVIKWGEKSFVCNTCNEKYEFFEVYEKKFEKKYEKFDIKESFYFKFYKRSRKSKGDEYCLEFSSFLPFLLELHESRLPPPPKPSGPWKGLGIPPPWYPDKWEENPWLDGIQQGELNWNPGPWWKDEYYSFKWENEGGRKKFKGWEKGSKYPLGPKDTKCMVCCSYLKFV